MTHKCIHSGDWPFSCGVCKKAFSQKIYMIRHKNLHSKSHIPVPMQGFSCHLIPHHHICGGDCVYFCYVWNSSIFYAVEPGMTS